MNTNTTSPSDRIFKSYWQDGSIDLFAGAGLALIGIGWLADLVSLAAIAPAILVPVWAAFRAKMIEPRLGHVRFDQPRRRRLLRAQAMLVLAGCMTFLLGVGAYLRLRDPSSAGELLVGLIPALPAVLVGLGGVMSAWLFGIPRLGLYGMASVAAGGLIALLRADPGWSLLAAGCLATASGGILMFRFFRRFPPLQSEIL